MVEVLMTAAASTCPALPPPPEPTPPPPPPPGPPPPRLPASPEAMEAAAMGSDDTAPHGLTVSHWQGPGLLAAVRRGDRPGAPARAARAANECPLEACAG